MQSEERAGGKAPGPGEFYNCCCRVHGWHRRLRDSQPDFGGMKNRVHLCRLQYSEAAQKHSSRKVTQPLDIERALLQPGNLQWDFEPATTQSSGMRNDCKYRAFVTKRHVENHRRPG